MWVRTAGNTLVNLQQIRTIAYVNTAIRAFGTDESESSYLLIETKTPALAQAAMDRLEKWIATGGTSENFMAETHNPQVFSFRTLSDDDEF